MVQMMAKRGARLRRSAWRVGARVGAAAEREVTVRAGRRRGAIVWRREVEAGVRVEVVAGAEAMLVAIWMIRGGFRDAMSLFLSSQLSVLFI